MKQAAKGLPKLGLVGVSKMMTCVATCTTRYRGVWVSSKKWMLLKRKQQQRQENEGEPVALKSLRRGDNLQYISLFYYINLYDIPQPCLRIHGAGASEFTPGGQGHRCMGDAPNGWRCRYASRVGREGMPCLWNSKWVPVAQYHLSHAGGPGWQPLCNSYETVRSGRDLALGSVAPA